MSATTSRTRRRPVGNVSLICLSTLLVAACASVSGGRGETDDADARLRAATAAFDEGDFQSGGRSLRALASRCESGDRGREAVLLLAAAGIDPRNPRPSPATTAHLSARYLQMSDVPPSSLAVAETLYLMALDLGANPVRDPLASIPSLEGEAGDVPGDPADPASDGAWTVADRFRDCDSDATSEPPVRRELPEHPGVPLWRAIERVRTERDSLARRAEEAERLRARADSLESELERIRSLLQQDPTSPDPPPGDDPP